MKTSFFVIILLLLCSRAKSQTFSPLPDSGGTWINHYSTYYLNQWNYPVYDYHMYLSFCTHGDDTLINTTNYYKVDTCGGGYKGALRENNGVVYYVPATDSIEYLLYDFTADSGDTIYDVYFEHPGGPSNLQDLKVHNTDSIQLENGEYRKRLYMEQSFWIEGVGNTQGLFWEPYGNVSMYFVELQCFLENDSIRFKANVPDSHCNWQTVKMDLKEKMDFKYYPNPARNKLKIIYQGNLPAELRIMDIQGKSIAKFQLNTSEMILNVSDVKAGAYFIQMTSDDARLVKQFIKL